MQLVRHTPRMHSTAIPSVHMDATEKVQVTGSIVAIKRAKTNGPGVNYINFILEVRAQQHLKNICLQRLFTPFVFSCFR